VTNWEPVSEAVNFCKECLLAFHAGKSSSMLTDYIYSTLQWKASNANADYLQYPLPLIRSLKYIDKMFLEGITPEDVARAADISKSYLFHIFKQHLQTSPYQLILEKRLNTAKYMLSTDLQPIKKIAAKCCFNSIEVFYRQFHKAFGISPKEYRHKYSVSLLPNALIGH
ncbi:MAG: helix-turn-helix transcriptional regulator, partial [Acholeplasmataceae bacterium]|nr:helix-turn-helix transcriptional regulator [Acholeplasmataceae bacterium]